MDTLQKKFLINSKLLPNIQDGLKTIGFPEDPERLEAIENHLELLVSKYFNKEYIDELNDFFLTEAGQSWLNLEQKLMEEMEKIVLAHISYARADMILQESNLLNDSYSDESDIPDSLN